MQSRGGLGPGWYIPAVVNAAIPGKQGAVSLNGWAFRKWTPDPNGGVADSLDEAEAAFGGRAPDARRTHVLGWS